MQIATELRFEIVDAFEKANISIPFPQRDVNLKLSDVEALADAIEKAQQKRRGKKPSGTE